MPTLVQRSTRNFGEYAEGATLIVEEQPTKEKRPLYHVCRQSLPRLKTGIRFYPLQSYYKKVKCGKI